MRQLRESWGPQRLASYHSLAVVVLLMLVCHGCSPYELRGTVMTGPGAAVVIANANDVRFEDAGLAGASVELVLDPNSISPQRLGTVQTDSQGRFQMGVDALGAGRFQEYNLGLIVTAKGHRNLWRTLKLPMAGKMLLITLRPGAAGRGDPSPPEDILGETLKFKDRFLGQ